MKKLFIVISLAFLLMMPYSVIAKEKDKGDKKKTKTNTTEVQPLSKPSYYEPYNIPGTKEYKKDYNSDWDEKTKDVKEAQ